MIWRPSRKCSPAARRARGTPSQPSGERLALRTMFNLSGKVALVTGASRGIGRAIASRLADQGAMVIAAARGDHANECVAELTARGQRAEALSLDVTDPTVVEAAPGAIVARHGRLDILVSNAGITR